MSANTQKLLKPAEGRRVRHPDGRLLAEAGEVLELTPYWHRRIDDEDVVASPAPKATKEN